MDKKLKEELMSIISDAIYATDPNLFSLNETDKERHMARNVIRALRDNDYLGADAGTRNNKNHFLSDALNSGNGTYKP